MAPILCRPRQDGYSPRTGDCDEANDQVIAMPLKCVAMESTKIAMVKTTVEVDADRDGFTPNEGDCDDDDLVVDLGGLRLAEMGLIRIVAAKTYPVMMSIRTRMDCLSRGDCNDENVRFDKV